jgi:nucleotide-binding universal stress UspA family protein
MFANVLVGVGRADDLDAVALAHRLVSRDGKLTLAHVFSGDTRLWRASGDEYRDAERARALELLEKARAGGGVDAELRSEESASPARGLHELAEALSVDLLVVGSSRRGRWGRVLLGDDALASLDGAPCAVAVAPAGYAHEPVAIREIGVAYNGSGESEHALAVARQIAAEQGARVSAFEVVSLPAYTFVGGPTPVDDTPTELVDDARARIAALGGVDAHAAYGNVGEELALYSASLDLLVVGSRNYGPVGRLVHGSTSRVMARRARCPLLVLPRGVLTSGAGTDAAESAGSGAGHGMRPSTAGRDR